MDLLYFTRVGTIVLEWLSIAQPRRAHVGVGAVGLVAVGFLPRWRQSVVVRGLRLDAQLYGSLLDGQGHLVQPSEVRHCNLVICLIR